MGASLVSLFQPRQGWSNEERAQFARIERLLEDAGFAVDVEHGLSDEGEPWCVFCSRITGDVVIHVACIDGRFMFASSTLPRPIEGSSFQRCAERFFEDVSLPMPLNERRGRVYLHPSAMLASLFITVLLYAQAVTEQPLFAEPALDLDDPDAVAEVPNPLVIRLKAIAQQVADFVYGPEGREAAAQGYANPALAAIPAGMAMAVIAIAQDLGKFAEPGLFDDDTATLAAAAATAAEPTGGETVRAAWVVPAEAGVGDDPLAAAEGPLNAAVPAAQAAEAVGEGAVAAIDAVEAAIAQIGGSLGAALALAGEAFAALGRLPDGLALVEAGQVAFAGVAEAAAELAEPSGLDTLLASIFGTGAGAAIETVVDSFVFRLADRPVEFEVIQVSGADFDRILAALVEAGGGAGSDGFDLSDDDFAPEPPTVVAPLPVSMPVAGGDAAPAAPVFVSPDPAVRVVSAAEFEAMLAEFGAEVGAFNPIGTGTDRLMFIDESYNQHVRSANLRFENVYLEDGTHVTFVGNAWDFDGFDSIA